MDFLFHALDLGLGIAELFFGVVDVFLVAIFRRFDGLIQLLLAVVEMFVGFVELIEKLIGDIRSGGRVLAVPFAFSWDGLSLNCRRLREEMEWELSDEC